MPVEPFRTASVPDNALAAIWQAFLIKLGNKTRRFCLQGRSQHPAHTATGNLGERVDDRAGLVNLADRGIFFHGVSLLREGLAGFDTAATLRLITPHRPFSDIARSVRAGGAVVFN